MKKISGTIFKKTSDILLLSVVLFVWIEVLPVSTESVTLDPDRPSQRIIDERWIVPEECKNSYNKTFFDALMLYCDKCRKWSSHDDMTTKLCRWIFIYLLATIFWIFLSELKVHYQFLGMIVSLQNILKLAWTYSLLPVPWMIYWNISSLTTKLVELFYILKNVKFNKNKPTPNNF